MTIKQVMQNQMHTNNILKNNQFSKVVEDKQGCSVD